MVFGRGRVGRPGLLGTVARTAVVAGTANATTNAMNRRRQTRDDGRQAYAREQEQERVAQEQQYAPPQPQYAPPAPDGGDDLIGKLQELAKLKDAGVLTDDEFAAAKAKLLAQ